MSIKSICKTQIATMPKDSTLKDISQLMQKKHVGSVVVTEAYDGKKIPAGIITDRDIALALGSSKNPQTLKVESIMQSQPITVKASEGIFATIAIMRKNGVKRLPVVTDDGSLFGIICADDLLSLMGEEINNLAKITETQIKKEQGVRIPVAKQVQL